MRIIQEDNKLFSSRTPQHIQDEKSGNKFIYIVQTKCVLGSYKEISTWMCVC